MGSLQDGDYSLDPIGDRPILEQSKRLSTEGAVLTVHLVTAVRIVNKLVQNASLHLTTFARFVEED